MTYKGLKPGLSTVVRARDSHRCRWCGRTDQPTDPHHIRYRRGASDDVPENLISLCRRCHDFVHGVPNGTGDTISKGEAQEILFELVTMPGVTGSALRRQKLRASAVLCPHGKRTDVGKCAQCLVTPLELRDAPADL